MGMFNGGFAGPPPLQDHGCPRLAGGEARDRGEERIIKEVNALGANQACGASRGTKARVPGAGIGLEPRASTH